MSKLTTTIALAALLSTAACTTNMNPGSGEPTRSGPAVGPTSPSSTPGTSGGNVPMISSFAATDPAAIMANRAEYRTKYLGPADPAPSGVVVPTDANTGQYQNPAVRVNPQLTVNSSVSSPAIPFTGVGDEAAGVIAVPAATTATPSATTAGSVAGGTTVNGAAAVGTTAGVTVPSAVATPGTTPGSAFVPTPATASVSVATPTAATVTTPQSMASASTSNVTSNATVTQSASVSVPATTSRLRIVSPSVGTGTSRIRIVRNTAGRVVVSNQQP